MDYYRVVFWGKKKNALGISSFHCVDAMAETPEEAILKVYDSHEHVSNPRVTKLPDFSG